MNWTDEDCTFLHTKVEEGWSAGQIGAELGMSRNAIIGKVRRLGLQLKGQGGSFHRAEKIRNLKPPPSQPRVHRAKNRRPVRAAFNVKSIPPKTPILPREIMTEPTTDTVKTFMELEDNHCRWPVEGGYCGVDTRYTYCEFHLEKKRGNG